MGKPRKNSRTKKFNYDKNRRKAWKKSKKLPSIECPQIKQAWDNKKSISRNLLEMGLSADPNKTLKIPRTKDKLKSSIPESMKVEDIPSLREQKRAMMKKKSKLHVVKELEDEANRPQPRRVQMSEPDVMFCKYMMDKHGEDYKAMARDRKNYYQDTPKQIKHKINTFKSIPEEYGKYLKERAISREACCCTPVRSCLEMKPEPRHGTRIFNATRRNGHFNTPLRVSKNRNRDGKRIHPDVLTMHRVRRKLNFGRLPPKIRQPQNGKPTAVRKKTKKQKLTRELKYLLPSPTCLILPTRLRPCVKALGDGDKTQFSGVSLHASPERTNLRESLRQN